jgi:hypothetical protein
VREFRLGNLPAAAQAHTQGDKTAASGQSSENAPITTGLYYVNIILL